MKKEKKELDRRALYRKYRIIGILQNIGIVLIVIAVMAGGAFGIYYLKNDYDKDMAEFRSSLNAEAASKEEEESRRNAEAAARATTQQPTSAEQPSTQHMMANAGGELDTSLTDQEKGYQEYIELQESTTVKEKDTTAAPTEPVTTKKEAVTAEAPSTTVKQTEAPTTTPPETTTKERETTPAPTTATREPETTPVPTTPAPTTAAKEQETTPAPTTTAKKQGVVITDEKTREALIQMGYDPDNYVASELSFSEKKQLLKLVFGGEATENPNRVVHESVDWSKETLPFDGSNLPKPMG